MSKCALIVFLISLVVFIVGTVTYFPIEFLIYYKLFNISWNSSQCIFSSFTNFEFNSQTKGGSFFTQYYTLINLQVNVDGKWKQGFACGSSMATMASSAYVFDAYPYEYGICSSPDVCENMLMLPVWWCYDCHDCDEYMTRESKECKWLFVNGNDEVSDVSELPDSYQLAFPTEDSNFIHVTFLDEPHYTESDYMGLQVVALGFCTILPFCICTGILCFYSIKKLKC